MNLFEANLNAIGAIAPDLLARIQNHQPTNENVKIFETPTGVKTASIITEDGKELLFHSKYNPELEAERQLEKYEIDEQDTLIVCGLGLGYIINPLFEKTTPFNIVIFVENSIGLFIEALKTVDFTNLLSKRDCHFFIGESIDKISALFNTDAPRFMGESFHFIIHPPSQRIFSAYYDNTRRLIKDYMVYGQITLATAMTLPYESIPNELANIKDYHCRPGVKEIKDKFKGYPAIIVSAGPSLHRNIDQLKDIQDKAVIISVSTSYKLLLSRGIIPHFVTVLDFHKVSKRYFEDVENDQTHLIAGPPATNHAIDCFNGPVSFYDCDNLKLILLEKHQERGEMRYGSTVAHLSYYLADYIGADPIIFMGQDLGHPDNVTHMPGSAIHEEWQPETNRFHTMEMKEWEQILRMRHTLIPTKDIHGNTIYSDEQMYSYNQTFKEEFKKSDRTIINCTEGGAMTEYCKIMPLKEAAEKYMDKVLPEELSQYKKDPIWKDDSKIYEVIDCVKERIREAEWVKKEYEDAYRYLKNAQKYLHDHVKRKNYINMANKCSAAFRRYQNMCDFVTCFIQADEIRRRRADRRLQASKLTGATLELQAIKRDVVYMKAVVAGIDIVLNELNKALKRLEKQAENYERNSSN